MAARSTLPSGVISRFVGVPTSSALLITGGIGTGRTRIARELAAAVPNSRFLAIRPIAASPSWAGREILRLAGELAGAQHGLLVVDDAHLCDADGAEFLAALLATPAAQRPRVAVTARSGWPLGPLPAVLADALAQLPQHELTPLTPDAVAELAAERLGAVPSAGCAAALRTATGGNPAALHGVLDDAVDRDAVLVIDDQAWLSPGHRLALPDDHPLPHRLAELPEPAVRVAELLAMVGPLPVAELAADAELSVPDTERAVAVLDAAGLFTGGADASADTHRRAIPVLWDAWCARSAPWRRAAAQLRVLTRRKPAVAHPLPDLATHAVRRGRTLRPAELDALLASPPHPDGGLDGGLDAVAAGLLPFAGLVPPPGIVDPAVRHWAGTGQWTAIAALPPDAVTGECVADRVRALLHTAGPTVALADLDEMAAHLDGELRAAVRAELLAYTGSADAVAELPDPPMLAAGDEIRTAWQQGRWADVLAEAIADRLSGHTALPLSTAGEAAAFAAEVWSDRGRPDYAAQWLTAASGGSDPAVPRPLTEWARAGLDLLLDRADAAVTRLDAVLAWMRHTRTTRHRDLLVARRIAALCAAGRPADAIAALGELATGFDRLAWLRGAVALAEAGVDHAVADPALAEYADLAAANGLPFDLARARLAMGGRTADRELVRAAAAGFAELGATTWEVRAAGVAQRVGAELVALRTPEAIDELISELVATGLSNAAIGHALWRTEMYVKRQVSRLLRATNTRHRAQLSARPKGAPGPRRSGPADPVRALAASTDPVVVLVGAPGSGRTTTLQRAHAALSTRDTSALVLMIDGRQARRDRTGLAGALLGRLGGPEGGDAEAVLTALRAAARTRPVVVLLDNADALDGPDLVLVRILAAAAGGRVRLVLGSVHGWPDLADLTGPPIRLPAPRAGRPTAPVRALTGRTPEEHRAAALLAALGECRLPELEPAFAEIGIPAVAARTVVWRLLSVGLLDQTADGRLRFTAGTLGAALAEGVGRDELRAVHRTLAEAMSRDFAAGRPVEPDRLAEHLAGAGAPFGHRDLVAIAEHRVSRDPARARRWCETVLAAEPDDPELAARACVALARACYDLARYREAVRAARRALATLPGDREADALAARTVLISSLVRTGEHDTALEVAGADPATADPGALRAVPDGLQQARILLLTERFDEALRTLSELRPTEPRHRVAMLAGVRVLAAIGAEGGAWLVAERHADELSVPMSSAGFDQARQALAWGDLYTAELAIMPSSHLPPAARRQRPPSMTRLSAAVTALRVGDWSTVLALAEEHAADGQENNYVNGLLAALAAEVLVHRNQPGEAAALLREFDGDQPFGHLVAWAAAGAELALGEPDRAVHRLAAGDRRCRERGYLTGRDLVLARQVDAQLSADDRAGALISSRRLAVLSARIKTRQATLYWRISQLAIGPTERTVAAALRLAEEFGDRFLIARIRLHEGQLGRPDALRAAHGEFRELGAVRWQRTAAELMRALGMSRRVPETISESDRRLIELIAGGATNQEAAAALHVTEKAVEARLTRIYRRTGLRSRVELVREFEAGQRDTA